MSVTRTLILESTRLSLLATSNPVTGTRIADVFIEYHNIAIEDQFDSIEVPTPLRFPDLTDIKIRVEGLTGAANGVAVANYSIFYEDE